MNNVIHTSSPRLPIIEILTVGAVELSSWDWEIGGDPFWRLYWNTDEGAFVLSEKRVPLSPDRLVLVAPGSKVALRLAGKTGHLFTEFLVSSPFDKPLPKVWALPLTQQESSELRQFYESRISRQSWGTAALKPLFWILRALAALPEKDWQHQCLDRRICRALELMEREISGELTVASLAGQCGMSCGAFARLFRQELSESPHQFLMRKRVERASLLLERTSLSLEEVAERCGFCDRFHFTRGFKRLRGVPPAEYRRQRTKAAEN